MTPERMNNRLRPHRLPPDRSHMIRPIVGSVSAGSPAARAGLRPGDRIRRPRTAVRRPSFPLLANGGQASDRKAASCSTCERAGSHFRTTLAAAPFDPHDPLRGHSRVRSKCARTPSPADELRESFRQNWKMLRFT